MNESHKTRTILVGFDHSPAAKNTGVTASMMSYAPITDSQLRHLKRCEYHIPRHNLDTKWKRKISIDGRDSV